ncbi:MAG: rhomboid family intramembrane serine protease [Mucilaginibacter sp.]
MEQYLLLTPVASIIFVLTIITTLITFSNEDLYGKMMLHPYSVSKGKYLYTLITSGLIHKDWMHLFFNMFSFYFFAFQLEATIGHWQFGLLYFLSMVLSDLPSVYKHKEDFWYHSLGASGAISAVIFSFILFSPMSKMMIMPIPIPIPAILFGVLYLLYCTYASKYSQDAINHDAHLFGALSGLLITIIMYPSVVHFFIGQITGAI